MLKLWIDIKRKIDIFTKIKTSTEKYVESLLGNFVADVLLSQNAISVCIKILRKTMMC